MCKVFFVCIVALRDTNCKPKWERYNIYFFVGFGVVHMGSPTILRQWLRRKTHVKENVNANRRLLYATEDYHANNALRRSVYASVDQDANNTMRRISRSQRKAQRLRTGNCIFRSLADESLGHVPPSYIGKCDLECEHSGALRWSTSGMMEPVGICCRKGKIRLPPLQPPPQPLLQWLELQTPSSKKFRRLLRLYNTALTMASSGVKVDSFAKGP